MGASKKTKHAQRKIIFIKKRLQFRYIANILISALFAFGITIHEVIWTAGQIAAKNPAVNDIMSEVKALTPVLALKCCLFLAILLLFAIVVSHQQAGPLYKFEKSFQKVKEGDLTCRAYLRKGDQLVEMQQEFNSMVYSLQQIIIAYENFRAYACGSGDPKVRERAEAAGETIKAIMPDIRV